MKIIPGKKPPRKYTSKYARVDLTGAYGVLEEMGKAANEEMREGMEQMARIGADKMQELISQRGTDFSAEAYAQGINRRPGRQRTGQMYNDVKWRAEIGPKKFLASFGWLYNFQDYYGYQETGFRNRGGWARPLAENRPFIRGENDWIWTEGMFALFDSRQYVKDMAKVIGPKIASKIATRGRKAGR